MNYLIGVDIGTTNVKAVALAADGRLLARAGRAVRTLTPFPGAAEQAPPLVARRTAEVIRAAAAVCARYGPPAGLVLSGAMHSLIAIDGDGACLTNAWLWSDGRAADFYRDLRASDEGGEIYRRTGTPIHPMSPLVKLLYLRRRQPGIFRRARCFLGIKDFVLKEIVGETVGDASLASTTGLLNTSSGAWDETALRIAGLTPDRLPRVVPCAGVFRLSAGRAARLGLPEGLPVVAGGSDGAMANLGSGADGPDRLAVTIATSAAVRLTLNAPRLDPAGRTFCYRLDDRRFLVGGASNNGSNVIDWLRREIFRGRRPPDRLLAEAARVAPGSDGVLFAPYIHGERAPLWHPGASGEFHGLTRGVGRAHLVRAAVEGVALNLRLIAEALPPWTACRSIALSGGAAQNPLWQRVVADAFDRPVEVAAPEAADASVLGAVMLAREALGLEPMPLPVPAKILPPEASGVKIYRTAFARFHELASTAGRSL